MNLEDGDVMRYVPKKMGSRIKKMARHDAHDSSIQRGKTLLHSYSREKASNPKHLF